MKSLISLSLLMACLALVSGAAMAEDRIEVAPAIIRGNSELPKVLYIVPWKKTVQGDGSVRQMTSVVNEELVPIDRDEFRRQLQYQSQQQARLQSQQAQPGKSSPP